CRRYRRLCRGLQQTSETRWHNVCRDVEPHRQKLRLRHRRGGICAALAAEGHAQLAEVPETLRGGPPCASERPYPPRHGGGDLQPDRGPLAPQPRLFRQLYAGRRQTRITPANFRIDRPPVFAVWETCIYGDLPWRLKNHRSPLRPSRIFPSSTACVSRPATPACATRPK